MTQADHDALFPELRRSGTRRSSRNGRSEQRNQSRSSRSSFVDARFECFDLWPAISGSRLVWSEASATYVEMTSKDCQDKANNARHKTAFRNLKHAKFVEYQLNQLSPAQCRAVKSFVKDRQDDELDREAKWSIVYASLRSVNQRQGILIRPEPRKIRVILKRHSQYETINGKELDGRLPATDFANSWRADTRSRPASRRSNARRSSRATEYREYQDVEDRGPLGELYGEGLAQQQQRMPMPPPPPPPPGPIQGQDYGPHEYQPEPAYQDQHDPRWQHAHAQHPQYATADHPDRPPPGQHPYTPWQGVGTRNPDQYEHDYHQQQQHGHNGAHHHHQQQQQQQQYQHAQSEYAHNDHRDHREQRDAAMMNEISGMMNDLRADFREQQHNNDIRHQQVQNEIRAQQHHQQQLHQQQLQQQQHQQQLQQQQQYYNHQRNHSRNTGRFTDDSEEYSHFSDSNFWGHDQRAIGDDGQWTPPSSTHNSPHQRPLGRNGSNYTSASRGHRNSGNQHHDNGRVYDFPTRHPSSIVHDDEHGGYNDYPGRAGESNLRDDPGYNFTVPRHGQRVPAGGARHGGGY